MLNVNEKLVKLLGYDAVNYVLNPNIKEKLTQSESNLLKLILDLRRDELLTKRFELNPFQCLSKYNISINENIANMISAAGFKFLGVQTINGNRGPYFLNTTNNQKYILTNKNINEALNNVDDNVNNNENQTFQEYVTGEVGKAKDEIHKTVRESNNLADEFVQKIHDSEEQVDRECTNLINQINNNDELTNEIKEKEINNIKNTKDEHIQLLRNDAKHFEDKTEKKMFDSIYEDIMKNASDDFKKGLKEVIATNNKYEKAAHIDDPNDFLIPGEKMPYNISTNDPSKVKTLRYVDRHQGIDNPENANYGDQAIDSMTNITVLNNNLNNTYGSIHYTNQNSSNIEAGDDTNLSTQIENSRMLSQLDDSGGE